MKSKLVLIFTIFTMTFAAAGCSAEKTSEYSDGETSYEMKYDSTVWSSEKNVEVEADYGIYTYSEVFTTKEKTEEGEPKASLMVLKEDLSEFNYSEDDMISDIADSLAARVPDGIVKKVRATIDGMEGCWIENEPMSEEDPIMDIIFFVADDSVYEFYYTAVDMESHELYENGDNGVNYMLYNFSLTE